MTFPWEKLEGAFVRVIERRDVDFYDTGCSVSFYKLFLIQQAGADGILSTMATEGGFRLDIDDAALDPEDMPETEVNVDGIGAMFKAQVINGEFDIVPLSAGVPMRAEFDIWHSDPLTPAEVEAWP